MNFDNLNRKYLVSAMYFKEDMKDEINYNLWVNDYSYQNIIPGNGKDNIKLSDIYVDDYRTNCLEIPKNDASITMLKDFKLGNTSFTIDFWMNLSICTSTMSNTSAFTNNNISWVSIDISDNIFIRLYNTGLHFQNQSTAIYGYFRNSNPGYFTNKAYQIISSNTNKLIHVLISYTHIISSIYSNKQNILNIYLNGIDIVDDSKRISIPIDIRDKVIINFMNRNSTIPLYISNFRVWDGVSLEIDENKEIYTSDNEYYKDLIFPYTDFVNLYYDVKRDDYKR